MSKRRRHGKVIPFPEPFYDEAYETQRFLQNFFDEMIPLALRRKEQLTSLLKLQDKTRSEFRLSTDTLLNLIREAEEGFWLLHAGLPPKMKEEWIEHVLERHGPMLRRIAEVRKKNREMAQAELERRKRANGAL
jgi:hypothetical protein